MAGGITTTVGWLSPTLFDELSTRTVVGL